MKKDTGYIVAGVVLSLAVGYYAYNRFFKVNAFPKQDDEKQPAEEKAESTIISSIVNPIGSGIASIGGSIASFLSSWNDYTVNTQSTPLNVRQQPNTSSKIVASIPKGTVVKAKASGTKDWLAVSKDGKNTVGYVSAQFLKAKF